MPFIQSVKSTASLPILFILPKGKYFIFCFLKHKFLSAKIVMTTLNQK
jgi:hypothetical protein